MDIKEMGFEGVDWIHLAGDRDQWWPIVNRIMILRVSYKSSEFLDNFLTS
jgi:hypothetical protein